LPSRTRQVLDDEQRPSARQRREIVRIVMAVVVMVCKKPGKRPSHREETLSELKETEEKFKVWPFLFQEFGMRLNFRELSGIQIDDTC